MARSRGIARSAVYFIKVMCAVIIVFASTFTAFTVGPVVETAFFPVVSKLKITSITDNSEGQSVVQAEFTKIRPCDYVGLAWYRGTQTGEFERVPVILLRKAGDNSSPNRPTGLQRAGPWVIDVPVSEIETGSFAQLTHRCHPFWSSVTNFYP